MIGFSIMMWFVCIVLLITAITLLKGNTSSIHGKIFRETKYKQDYAKALGKVVLFIGIAIGASGFVGCFVPLHQAL